MMIIKEQPSVFKLRLTWIFGAFQLGGVWAICASVKKNIKKPLNTSPKP
jgi:hypothetical protein